MKVSTLIEPQTAEALDVPLGGFCELSPSAIGREEYALFTADTRWWPRPKHKRHTSESVSRVNRGNYRVERIDEATHGELLDLILGL